jgi:hypothetical protein
MKLRNSPYDSNIDKHPFFFESSFSKKHRKRRNFYFEMSNLTSLASCNQIESTAQKNGAAQDGSELERIIMNGNEEEDSLPVDLLFWSGASTALSFVLKNLGGGGEMKPIP